MTTQIVDYNLDTFLNVDYYERIKSEIESLIENIKNNKSKMKTISKHFKYVKKFQTKSVQGIAGILEIKTQPVKKGSKVETKPQVVFKISLDIDRAIEHEYIITKQLNNLRKVCPHFMSSYNMVSLPISNNFIDQRRKEDKIDLFKSDNNYLPTSMLLLEYVSDICFYHVCKYGDRNQILTQIFMILLALQIGQNKTNFTHYDLHMDNILIRRCEEDSFFVYIINGKLYCVPTYGFFPVMIDMGSSFIDNLEGNPMYTDIGNYNNGLQPTLYDSMNDMHHLLLSAFYYIEDQSKEFDVLSGRIMYYFKNIPVLRKKGWKQLPVDLKDNIFDYIYSLDPQLENNKLIKDFDIDLINILCYSVRLPWTPLDNDKSGSKDENVTNNKEVMDKEFITVFKYIINSFEKFNKVDLIHDFDVLYILRELIGIIDKNREKLENDWNNTSIYKNIERDFRNEIAFLVTKKDFPNINFEQLIKNIIILSKHLSSFYYYNVKENVEVINECYLKSSITSPVKMYEKLRQNVAIRNSFTSETILYFMDSDKSSRNRIKVSELLQPYEVDRLNRVNRVEQEKILKSLYEKHS